MRTKGGAPTGVGLAKTASVVANKRILQSIVYRIPESALSDLCHCHCHLSSAHGHYADIPHRRHSLRTDQINRTGSLLLLLLLLLLLVVVLLLLPLKQWR